MNMEQSKKAKRNWFVGVRKMACLLLCAVITASAAVAAVPAVPAQAASKLEEYDYVGSFSDGLALVYKIIKPGKDEQSKYGFINKKGKLVIEMQYDLAQNFSEGLACVRKGDRSYYINTKGEIVIKLPKGASSLSFSEGLAWVKSENGKYSYINKKGKTVIKLSASYVGAGSFSDGLACVKKKDGDGYKYGFINKKGKIAIKAQYSHAPSNFSEGLATVTDDNYKMGYIDKKGNEVIKPQYDMAYSFSEGLALVEKDGKCGFIDQTGKEVIELKYEGKSYAASDGFFEGVAGVQDGKDIVLLDQTGKEIARLKDAEKVERFSDGLALLEKDYNDCAYIDKTGKVVIKGPYDPSLSTSFSDGLARVCKDGKCFYINKKGKVVIK